MKNKYIIRENSILFAYILWMFSAILGITMWRKFDIIGEFRTYSVQIAYLILVISFFFKDRYTRKDVLGIFVIIFCCIVSGQSVHNKSIVPVSIFVYFMSSIDFRKVLKWTLALQFGVMLITIFASQIGFLEDVIWIEGERIRHSLGYDYCGYPGHVMLFMTLSWFGIRKKAGIVEGFIWLGLNYYIYVLTDARTDFYLSALGIAGFYLFCGNWKKRVLAVIRDKMMVYGFWLAALSSIIMHWVYDAENQLMSRVNNFLNGRLLLGYDAIQEYGFSLFGQKIRWFGQGSLRTDPTRIYNYVDCSFLKEALSYGIVFLILLGIGFYFACKNTVKMKDYTIGWAVLISLAYSVINAHLCVLTFNVFILVLGNCFSEKNMCVEISGEYIDEKEKYVE